MSFSSHVIVLSQVKKSSGEANPGKKPLNIDQVDFERFFELPLLPGGR